MIIVQYFLKLYFSFFSVSPTSYSRSEVNIHCDQCSIDIPKRKLISHLKTNKHKSNSLLKTEFHNIEIVATAFKKRIVTYRLYPEQENEYLTANDFLFDKKNDIFKLINLSLLKHGCIKINFELFACFVLQKTDEQQIKSFNSKYVIIYKNTDLNEIYDTSSNVLEQKLTEFEHCESGWSFSSICHLELNINKYNPLRGGTYIELPEKIKNTKSCLNIRNSDYHCFLWSIVASLFPAKRNVCRTTSYPHYSEILNIEGMSFPPTLDDIKLFEKNNPTISVNVYGLDAQNCVTGPLYMSSKKSSHVHLLYIESKGEGHYCLIKDLIRLVRRQITLHKGNIYLCDGCLQFFSSEIKFGTHNCSKVLSILPKKNSLLEFKNYKRQQKINFVIYADFESMLSNFTVNSSVNTKNLKLHTPTCFAYYVCCSHDSTLNKYVTYRGEDCVNVFITSLIEDVENINSILCDPKPMKPLTPQENFDFENAKTCHICKKPLTTDRVRDHDHVTSQYRGAAHVRCNLQYRRCSFVPVVFHNLSGYDCHLFIQELVKHKGPTKVIPKSKEKYMAITKTIVSEKSCRSIQIKFIDSFQFLSSSLDELSSNLNAEDFIHMKKQFGETKINLLRQKGIYPYDYIDMWSKYDENQLPPKECFYNALKLENISDIDYARAQSVWKALNINSLGEYTDLYLKCDVLLLCDIFEKFRNTSLQNYNLDPAHYISAPSLSWDAMLLYTGVQLELISNIEIYEMIEKGIRGGLAQCSLRHAKANNIYVPNFNDDEVSSYLIYLDCNNLYGYALKKKLPISDFTLLRKDEIDAFDVQSVSDDGKYGYILEVDLTYPRHLHDSHRDLPFAPEKLKPPGGKTVKLIANVYDKYNYVIHYTHLKQCLKHGLGLKKIHKILKFKQDNFLETYIDLNTKLRQASTSAFEKGFFKLLNNAVFGKTIQNKRKQVDVKLVTKWKDTDNSTKKQLCAEDLIARPNLKSVTIFSENFLAIQLKPEKLILDKPIYIGFTVLEYAKQHLYNFHYDFIKTKYSNKVKLCYTDTDSLLYLIETENVYRDIRDNLSEFDTSNFEKDNPYAIPKINEKIPGLFKDELGGLVITEFVGLRAKLYCIKSVKTTIKKAKGISKPVVKKLDLSHYNDVLYSNKILKCKMNIIRSIKHVLYSQQMNKIALSGTDDKRQVLPNQIETLPWGHCDSDPVFNYDLT